LSTEALKLYTSRSSNTIIGSKTRQKQFHTHNQIMREQNTQLFESECNPKNSKILHNKNYYLKMEKGHLNWICV